MYRKNNYLFRIHIVEKIRSNVEIFVNDIKINQYIGYSGQMMQVLIITN